MQFFYIQMMFGIFLSSTSVWAQGRSFELSELIELTVRHAPQLQAVHQERHIQDLKLDNSFALFLPSFDLAATHGVGRSLTADNGEPWQSKLSLKISENLYDNGESWVKYRSAQSSVNLSKLNVDQVHQDVVLEVVEAYLSLSLADHLYQANQILRKTLNSQFRLAESQYREGMRTRKDFLRFQGEVQRSQMQDVQLLNARQMALQKLARLAGFDPLAADFQVQVFDPRKQTIPPPPARRLGAQQTLSAKIFALQQQVRDFDIELVRKRNLPQLKLIGDLSYTSADYMGTSYAPYLRDDLSWGVALSLEYNIWDFGMRRRDLEVAIAQKSQESFNQQAKMQTMDQDLSALYADLELAMQNLKLAQELLKFEEEGIGLLDSEYRQGRASYLELVEGLKNLSSARSGYFQTVFTYLRQLSKYSYYEGSIVTFHL